MKNLLIIAFVAVLSSCSQPQPDLTNLINESRKQMEDLAMATGYTERDKSIISEYDKIANLIDTNDPDALHTLTNSQLLKQEQIIELKTAIEANIDNSTLKLALLNFYKPNMIDYNFPLDACNVEFTKDGIVRISFYNSALTNHIEFTTNRNDFEQGNLKRQDFDYGSTELKLNGLTEGDSVFGYYSYPYFNMEDFKVEFKGKYEETSR